MSEPTTDRLVTQISQIQQITFIFDHEPMEQRGQSKRACNLPSRDRGRPKVNFTDLHGFIIKYKNYGKYLRQPSV